MPSTATERRKASPPRQCGHRVPFDAAFYTKRLPVLRLPHFHRRRSPRATTSGGGAVAVWKL